MKVFVVDDERPARERLKQLLAERPGVAFCGEADNGRDALERIQDLQPDIVLLDIRMPQMSGLEAARHLTQLATPPALVFTTAYDEYAVAAFDTSAVAYLLKPIRAEHLDKALTNARQLNRAQLANVAQPGGSPSAATRTAQDAPRTHLCIRLGNRLELVAVADIFYFMAEQKYVTVRHREGEAVIEESLKSLETEFSDQVLRVHRNALVTLERISGLEKTTLGRYQIVFKELDERLEVSRRLVAAVRKRIRSL